ncbi:ABC transporter ATP-binding protein [Bacillus sonorensis]|nr:MULTISPECIES: ABC transporter ATP-binding protein [Bacillus]TWK82695.1 Oligopeptide transport ATP-binding protein OppD [Bacillus paralicheniformis]ASB88588.1 Hemin import ATP-binding protein HmuV [Bacillus sonorensis]MBG9915590.1 peptide ABC transporter ATPase [Bacillus sonorensis]MCF7617944.1 ABC transporter ATP-binding protein [Bacillus sonorensis]MCY7856664.1 ABC transporter ATP-binding protein [Bacillus sonorensis]
MPILSIEGLTISRRQHAIVKNVSFSIHKGEWFALLGESGSGKSLTASAITGLLPGGLTVSAGHVRFGEHSMLEANRRELRHIRGKEIAFIFQNCHAAFTPFIRIGRQIDEMVKAHTDWPEKKRKAEILRSFQEVCLPENRVYESYPFQLSGGQLQRAAIAQAMVLKPQLLIADEPTTALDSITAADVLQQLAMLRDKTNCAVLFITHDLRLVERYADQTAVMQNGAIVENGRTATIIKRPQHEYTKRLFAAVPPLKNPPLRLMAKKQTALTGTGGAL